MDSLMEGINVTGAVGRCNIERKSEEDLIRVPFEAIVIRPLDGASTDGNTPGGWDYPGCAVRKSLGSLPLLDQAAACSVRSLSVRTSRSASDHDSTWSMSAPQVMARCGRGLSGLLARRYRRSQKNSLPKRRANSSRGSRRDDETPTGH